MKNPFQKKILTDHSFFWMLVILALTPWLFFRAQQATHSDILWLCEALQRILNGQTMADAAYEGNPPLSMLVYILPVLAKDLLHIPLHYAVFVQTLILSALSTLAVYKIVSAWKVLQPDAVRLMTAGYLFGITIMTSIYFGERDHLVALGLAPFVLLQVTMTVRLPRAKSWSIPVLVGGAAMILLKPHHGLIPTILLFHRMILQRRLSVVLDADFISLTIAVLAYLATIFLSFPDYAFIIFPDALRLYLPIGGLDKILETLCWTTALIAALILILPRLKMPRQETLLILFFLICALLSLIPYTVQKMGLHYHMLPVFAFLCPAMAMMGLGLIKREIAKPGWQAALSLFLMITACYLYSPLNIRYPDHRRFAETPLAKIVSQCPGEKTCSFFIFNREMGLVHETAYYTGAQYVSRFASLWFLPVLISTQKAMDRGESSPLSKEEFQLYFDRFVTMMAEDISDKKPDHVIIWDWKAAGPGVEFVPYFSRNPQFAAAMEAYKETGAFQLKYSDYYTGLVKADSEPLDYTVYERR